jgi:hypothetical protein
MYYRNVALKGINGVVNQNVTVAQIEVFVAEAEFLRAGNKLAAAKAKAIYHNMEEMDQSERKAVEEAIDKSPIKERLKFETVRSRLRYQKVAKKKVRDQTKLGTALENFLVQLIIAFSVQLMSMTRRMLVGFAEMLAPEQAPLSHKWYKHFLKRHRQEIRERAGKKSHKRKVLLGAYETIKEWCDRQKVVMTKQKRSLRACVNA